MQSVDELFRFLSVIVFHEPSEYIVRGYLETVDNRYLVCLVVLLVRCNVVVLADLRHVAHESVIGRDLVFELNLAVLEECGHCYSLKDRSGLCRGSCGHVEHFPELSFLVLLEVYHCPYGSCLHIHDNNAASHNVLFCRHVVPQGLVGHVLNVYVKRCPYVKSIFNCNHAAVHVLDHIPSVGDLHPFEAFLSVEDVVVYAFYAYVERICVAVVLHISYDSSCEAVVWVLPCLLLLHDHSAPIPSFVEQRQGLELKQLAVVYALGYRHISALVSSSCKDEVAVVCCILSVLQHLRQPFGKFLCLLYPCLLLFRSLLLVFHQSVLFLHYVAVHVDVVHRRRHGQKLSVVV